MSGDDPVRLVEGGEAPEALQSVLRAGREALPDSSQIDALASKLGPMLGAAAGGAAVGAAASSATASGAPAGAAASTVAKVLAGVVLAGAVAGGGYYVVERGSQAEAPRQAPPPAVRPAVTPSPSEAERPESARTQSADPVAQAPSQATPARAAALKESDLLQAAQRALATNPERALAITRTHRQRFPNGVLAQERDVIAIEALSRLGRKDEANERATDFQRAYPGSAHQRKVESAVEP